jgi:hypothetical protein
LFLTKSSQCACACHQQAQHPMFWLHAKEPNWMNTLLAITYGRHCDLSILLCMQGCRHMSSVRYFSYAFGVNGIGEELLMAEHHSLGRMRPWLTCWHHPNEKDEKVNPLRPFGSPKERRSRPRATQWIPQRLLRDTHGRRIDVSR